MRALILIACGLIVLLPSSFKFEGGDRDGATSDAVSKAFDEYERLWRQAAAKAVEQLEAGTLDTDTATHEFLAEAGEAARRAAFQPIADAEESAYMSEDENGEQIRIEWTPDKHAEILRGYLTE